MGIRADAPGAARPDPSLDLEALLHPANAFSTPADVLGDPELTLNEKRAILAAWASDACAVESAPSLRISPLAGRPVSFDDVMDALRELDKVAAQGGRPLPHYRRVIARGRLAAGEAGKQRPDGGIRG